jgi:NitT/TauT family transport system permease protein
MAMIAKTEETSRSATPAIRDLTLGFRFVRWLKSLWSLNLLLGVMSLSTVAFIWEFAGPLGIPGVKNMPPPSSVITAATDLLIAEQYWKGWQLSFQRIGIGFLLAQAIGIPLGLIMAMNRFSFGTIFPIIEILRPIPPVAWIPISIVFWPTREQSVVFIVFLGAFWIVLLNTIGGASQIDRKFKRAALSLGSTPRDLFWKIILPATIPSIITGMAVGMGISWEMVVASEMIAGNTGLGYLLWQSFEIGAIAHVVVCMISIGFAGYFSSALIRALGGLATPWRRLH